MKQAKLSHTSVHPLRSLAHNLDKTMLPLDLPRIPKPLACLLKLLPIAHREYPTFEHNLTFARKVYYCILKPFTNDTP
jgi:hypothetical protein